MANYPNLISATVVADSITERGHRMTTFELVFPRFILAELNTHSMLKRNSASSRAIPFDKMVREVTERPFIPIAWQKNHSGMQGTEYHTEPMYLHAAEKNWLQARDYAVKQATLLNKNCDVTKQLANRMLEPYMYHKVLITGTDFQNFFDLRCPQYVFPSMPNFKFKSKKEVRSGCTFANSLSDSEWLFVNQGQAEIHIMDLAEKMYDAYNESKPSLLKVNEWHIPYGDKMDFGAINDLIDKEFKTEAEIAIEFNNKKLAIAVARCARLSYQTLGDNPKIDYQKDLALHDILLSQKHMSPFEHIGKVMSEKEYYSHFRGQLPIFQENSRENREGSIFVPEIYPVEIEEGGVDTYHLLDSFGWNKNIRGFVQYRSLVE